MGLGLESALARAGFTVEGTRSEAVLISPTMHHPAATIVRAMLPRITRHGVATEQEIGLATLDGCLIEEPTKAGTSFVWELISGVWGANRIKGQTSKSLL